LQRFDDRLENLPLKSLGIADQRRSYLERMGLATQVFADPECCARDKFCDTLRALAVTAINLLSAFWTSILLVIARNIDANTSDIEDRHKRNQDCCHENAGVESLAAHYTLQEQQPVAVCRYIQCFVLGVDSCCFSSILQLPAKSQRAKMKNSRFQSNYGQALSLGFLISL